MKLHIISDGTVPGTRVTDTETGKAVERLKRIEIVYDAEAGCSSVLHFFRPEGDLVISTTYKDDELEALLTSPSCPSCQHASILHKDGRCTVRGCPCA